MTLLQNPERPPTIVAVRELCEFTAKRGDLDLRFTPSPTSQEGIDGHKLISSRRGDGYAREVTLQSEHLGLTIRGRADGVRNSPPAVEEVKTYRGDLARMPDNHRALHKAQLWIYAAQRCADKNLDAIDASLTYFNVDTQKEVSLTESCSAESLAQFFADHCQRYLDWDLQQQAHKASRNAALTAIVFPHPKFHAGQRQLAKAVYRAAVQKQHLLAQAPTGIGKSIGTLFPALKAMAAGHVDKIFFLTAKTSGRAMALQAVKTLQSANAATALPLRTLELIAREKACEHPDMACHGESCPLAKGFYDRLPAARAAALEAASRGQVLDQQSLRAVASAHQVCPYYLAQELTRWCDVIVGDYNYYFDKSALLYGLTVLNEWRVSVLVDEAHNLVDRGRAMYSAELSQQALLALKKTAPAVIGKALSQLNTAWSKATRDQVEDYKTYPAPPIVVIDALKKTAATVGDYFTDHSEDARGELQRFYFDVLVFLQLAEQFGPHSLFDVRQQTARSGTGSTILGLRNVVPAPFLKPRVEVAHSLVAFSATLNPAQYYLDLLGLSERTGWIDVASPFLPEQLEVQIADHISTRYRDREASIKPIATLMAAQYRRRPGNYLAFFSSFDYLHQVQAALGQLDAELPIWSQSARMAESERTAFLQRFEETGQGIGFAVLGGVFAEGIDLPGQRLIGAFIATLGLPQLNPINEEMRQRMETLFGAGYDYTYFYPGLRKVVQAAGRVIRTRDDQGIVVLIDDRFGHRKTQNLLPDWWGRSSMLG